MARWRFPLRTLLLLLLLAGGGISLSAAGMGIPQIQYQSNDEFIAQAFPGATPQWKMLRLDAQLKKTAAQILQHPYAGMRLRYWIDGERTAWIIDETGKEMPITIGIVAQGDVIEQVKILVYREERGGEVHQAFFTDQFRQVTLTGAGDLSKPIDGITGATLSVNAVSRVAQLVLVMQRRVLGRPAP